MSRILGNLGRSVALFLPTLFCLYGTHLYALNLFRFLVIYKVSISDQMIGIWYGFLYILGGSVAYLIAVTLWWGLINAIWRNHPDWLSPKSWSNLFIDFAIATLCLFLAFLCEPSLWMGAFIFLTDNQAYVLQLLQSTFLKFASIWFLAVNIIYFFKTIPKQAGRVNRSQSKQFRQEQDSRQIDELSLEREKELLTLVRDRKTCERLLKGLSRQYPNETRLWIIEKAISDIYRDRRVY